MIFFLGFLFVHIFVMPPEKKWHGISIPLLVSLGALAKAIQTEMTFRIRFIRLYRNLNIHTDEEMSELLNNSECLFDYVYRSEDRIINLSNIITYRFSDILGINKSFPQKSDDSFLRQYGIEIVLKERHKTDYMGFSEIERFNKYYKLFLELMAKYND